MSRDIREMRRLTAESVAPIAESWDQLPTGLFGMANWLRTAEAVTSMPSRYDVLLSQDVVRSGLISWTMTGDAWLYNNPVALLLLGGDDVRTRFTGRERRRIDELVDELKAVQEQLYPATVSALPSGYLPGMLMGDHADAGALLDLLEDSPSAGTTAVMHVPESEVALATQLERRGYSAFCAAGDAILETGTFASFDDYLRSLSKPRRNRARRERAAFRASGAVVRERGVHDLGSMHASLHKAHLERYGHRTKEGYSEQLIRLIQQNPTATPRVLEVVQGGRVSGFLVFYELDRVYYASMIGLLSDAPFAYFNLVYYEVVARAASAGVSRIHYGPDTYRAKRGRGCRIEPRISFVRVPPRWRSTVGELAQLLDSGYRRELWDERSE